MGIAPGKATTASDWALDLSQVSKVYRGRVHALRGIDMRVRRGEIFGLLGPNGAGKSTLVKILMTVIAPTRAQGTVLGHPVGHKPTLARVGYLPEHHRFPEYLTGEQVVDFFGALSGVPRETRRRRTPELLEMVGMKEWARTKVRGYSKGMRQRVGIAQALAADPELVLLDEPTDGVDPVGRRDIREMCVRLRKQGKTVFLNSHLLSELEMVCDRVAILVQGTVASQGTLDELTRDRQYYEVSLTEPPPEGYEHCVAPGIRVWREGTSIRLGTVEPAEVMPLLDWLRARRATIRAVRPFRPSLDDLFMEAVTDKATGKVLAPGAAQSVSRNGGAA